MDYIPEYSKYSLDTLYEILSNMDKEEHPERVKEIVNRISSLEDASLRNQKGKKNKNRLKYALLSSEERLKVSQDPFACFKFVNWTYHDMLVGICILIVYHGIGKILGYYNHFGINILIIFFTYLIIAFVFEITLLSFPFYICHKRNIWPLFPTLSFSKLLKEFFRSIGYFFIIVLSIGLIMKLIEIMTKSPMEPPEAWKWAEYAPKNFYFMLFLIFCFTFAPIVEEIFFRGFLYNALKIHFPVIFAAIVQATIFAFIHPYDLMNRLNVFLIGIGLVIVYEKRKNLISPIIVHSMFNFSWALIILLK